MKKFFAASVLSLFLAYLAGTSCFLHTHIVNGVTIVHSHFYNSPSEDTGERNSHQHSTSELTLIATLSHIESDPPSTLIAPPDILPDQMTIPVPGGTDYSFAGCFLSYSLRGPPLS